MGPIATRRLMGRLRGHLAGALVVLALAGTVVLHHAEMPAGEMGAMPGSSSSMSMSSHAAHHGDSGMASMCMCLGAFVALGAAVAFLRRGSVRLGRWRPAHVLPVRELLRADLRPSLSRAGPPGLPVLGVWRI